MCYIKTNNIQILLLFIINKIISRWSKADLQTVCRHLGYRGGQFLRWMEPNIDKLNSRLMLSDLQCEGTENNLYECKGWENKKLGSGSCGM